MTSYRRLEEQWYRRLLRLREAIIFVFGVAVGMLIACEFLGACG